MKKEFTSQSTRLGSQTWRLLGAMLSCLLLTAIALNLHAAPAISWTPESISQTIESGETKKITVELVSQEDLPNVSIRIVPELQSILQIDPPNVSALQKGQRLHIVLSFHAAATATPATFEGAIQIRTQDKNSKTVARPLPVTAKIVWTKFIDQNTGNSISYPDFGLLSQVSKSTTADGDISLDFQIFSKIRNDYVSAFVVLLIANTEHKSLPDWFSNAIDQDGILLKNNALETRTLSNATQAIIPKKPIPPEYIDKFGPLPGIYGLSKDGGTIISITKSQESEIGLYGVRVEATADFLASILSTFESQ